LQTFETIEYAIAYPKGAVLFVEGQAPRGIFVLCKGRVELSICLVRRQDPNSEDC
jgi:CRP/FNR family transcriptional regulator